MSYPWWKCRKYLHNNFVYIIKDTVMQIIWRIYAQLNLKSRLLFKKIENFTGKLLQNYKYNAKFSGLFETRKR